MEGSPGRARLAAACGGCADGDLGPDLGGRCRSNAECSERRLPERDYPGGFCTLNCDSDCGVVADAQRCARVTMRRAITP